MNITDWISFGKISAEKDDDLSKYFYDNRVLSKVVASNTASLVLGRKGAGKTAVFKHLTEYPAKILGDDSLLIAMSFENYNWNVHALLSDRMKAESLLYKQSWKFVIYIECVRAYCEWHKNNGRTLPKALAKANKLLEKIFSSPIPSIAQIVGNKLLSLSKLSLPSIGFDISDVAVDSLSIDGGEVSFDHVKTDSQLQQALSQNINFVIEVIEQVLKGICRDHPKIFLCFDRVDEAWDDVSYEDSKLVIAGLISAADTITSTYGGKLRPIVFLREDIFDTLSINDKNKLKADCGALLKWDYESLVKLLLVRVNYFASLHGQQAIPDINDLFDRVEMRQRTKPIKYILKRTMMRPRDIIYFLNKVLESMVDNYRDPFSESRHESAKIECEFIYTAEPGYSEWLYQEILDEWRVQKPHISNVFKAIQDIATTNFQLEHFVATLNKFIPNISRAEANEHLRFLYENSIVGFKVGGSSEWRFKCFYPSQGYTDSDEFRVHEGLVRSLSLRETREV